MTRTGLAVVLAWVAILLGVACGGGGSKPPMQPDNDLNSLGGDGGPEPTSPAPAPAPH